MPTKRIFYSNTSIHTYLKSMFSHPPKGYEFIVSSKKDTEKTISKLRASKTASYIYKNVIRKYFNVLPILNKVYTSKSPENIDLILSTTTVIKENKPWILLILDTVYCLTGMDYPLFIKSKSSLQSSLEDDNCRGIIVHTRESKELVEKHFSNKVAKKVVLVTPGIPIRKGHIKKRANKDFTLLFMGSINNPHEFLIKGGLEALEVFTLLNKKYNNIKLIMKCIVPEEYKLKYRNNNITFIDSLVSEEEVEKIYERSDILISAGCGYFIMAYFEAFSHGLPILAYNTMGVSDFVFPGKNGFIVQPSKNLLIDTEDYPANVRSDEFKNSIKNIDPQAISNLAEKAEILINDDNIRNSMRKQTFKIFKDKFSIENQNKQLKIIFDKVIKNGN
ncbi:MAG: glycosyltransferase family 4 protein [Nanoarchaeota archaeon]